MDLIVDNLNFSYGDKKVLHDIVFKSDAGEVIGILGQNGCGKTTLLKCINRLLVPEGDVSVCNFGEGVLEPHSKAANDDGTASVDRMVPKELARSMAVVAQSAYSTFPYTAFDAVMMGRYSRSSSIGSAAKEDDIRICTDSLEKAGVLHLAHRNVMELSGGEFRRVMIARALAQQSEILLLDEPTLHLDVSHQFDLMDLIRDLSSNMGKRVIMVTHDMVFAARYCDRVILLKDGHIVASGRTEDVMTVQNMRDIFDVETDIRYDERIGGINIELLGRYRKEDCDGSGTSK